jgi:hypothetical protein
VPMADHILHTRRDADYIGCLAAVRRFCRHPQSGLEKTLRRHARRLCRDCHMRLGSPDGTPGLIPPRTRDPHLKWARELQQLLDEIDRDRPEVDDPRWELLAATEALISLTRAQTVRGLLVQIDLVTKWCEDIAFDDAILSALRSIRDGIEQLNRSASA